MIVNPAGFTFFFLNKMITPTVSCVNLIVIADIFFFIYRDCFF